MAITMDWGKSDPRWLLLPAALAVAALAVPFVPLRVEPALPSAFVKVETATGHGSATHIGNGLYITAAHVVADSAEVKINGAKSPVLWANSTYDIALVSGPEHAASVPLACVVPDVGATGLLHGNPLFLDDVEVGASVAGTPRELQTWKVVVPIDGTLLPGMSGGGFIVGGALVGVNVGLLSVQLGLSTSATGIGVVVPASVVCDLMGRV